MGYEIRLYIGREGMSGPQYGDDHAVEGKTQTYFSVYAMIDLCKIGDSHVSKIDFVNKDENRRWYFYGEDGDTEITTDPYGDSPKPVPISEVIAALRKDVKEDSYRRFKWALALLEAMSTHSEDEALSVLFMGH